MHIHSSRFPALAVSTLIAANLVIPVYAANYTPVQGTSTTFDKYLVMDSDANVPNAEFAFTISAGTPISAASGTMEVLAGPVEANAPVITSTAVFTPQDTTYSTVQGGDILTLDTGEKYAVKTLTVDFRGVSFDEPGIYRYVISETPLADAGPITQDDTDKILDVYVVDNNGSLEVASYVMHTSTDAPAAGSANGSGDVAAQGDALSDKVSGFINTYSTKDLTLTKLVSGNQASKDKYFRFTLEITGAGSGSRLTVDVTESADQAPLANSATVYSASAMTTANSVTELVCDEDGAVTQDFYLKHGQTITVRQLPEGASYTVTEVAEDYLSAALNTVDASAYQANSGVISTDDVHTGFQNTREGVIPTGIAMSIAPYLCIGLLGAAGLIFKRTYSDIG